MTRGQHHRREPTTALWWNTKMHIFGGTDGYTWYNDMWSYEPVTNRWEHIPTDTRHWKRPTRREGHTAAVGGNKMRVFGGRSEMGEDLKDFWIFDMAERRWRDSLQNMDGLPSPRSGHSMVVIGKHIVVLGGEPSSSKHANREELALDYVLDTTKSQTP
ncbi:Negative regulator of mitotic exit [Podospora bellae-mahoneyi]|uniref:Negative regulator of mitotic exit n=1 Tax=Podospora bellae-mahoneyi TaxID=2093777 RepID=A0ABR0FP63_9PEZI|nr:Negative regulator of mitotic exit [Podospora bellae-mahoneyi]